MNVKKEELISAASNLGLSAQQGEDLWKVLENQRVATNRFDVANVLYYLGALITLSAMTWYLGFNWKTFGSGGILCITLVYMVIFLFMGNHLWKKHLKTPGGLFITLAVSLTPLAIYSFQDYTGLWGGVTPGSYSDFFSWIKGGWFFMEIGTVLAGLVALHFYRFPFLTAPIFFSLWFMSMDVTQLMLPYSASMWSDRLWVTIGFGVVILLIAYLIDQRTEEDYAFWGYFFGVLSFWGGLSLLDHEMDKISYCLTNIVFILCAILLQRRIFLIFGVSGIFIYIGALFGLYFTESALFPIILSLIGIVIIFLGIVYHKNHQKVEQLILNSLPEWIKKGLPKARR